MLANILKYLLNTWTQLEMLWMIQKLYIQGLFVPSPKKSDFFRQAGNFFSFNNQTLLFYPYTEKKVYSYGNLFVRTERVRRNRSHNPEEKSTSFIKIE